MDEIKFYGRGGQGFVMASQMLGFAFFKAGFYPQCFSVFGGERRGAPVVSFLRVDREKILLKCGIKQLLFAADMPLGDSQMGYRNYRQTINAIEQMDIGDDARKKIFEDNVRNLLRLPV